MRLSEAALNSVGFRACPPAPLHPTNPFDGRDSHGSGSHGSENSGVANSEERTSGQNLAMITLAVPEFEFSSVE